MAISTNWGLHERLKQLENIIVEVSVRIPPRQPQALNEEPQPQTYLNRMESAQRRAHDKALMEEETP